MASSIKYSEILASQGVEHVVLVSGLGTLYHLYLAISDAANRDANISAAKAQLDANDAAIQAYSQTNNVPVAPAAPAAPAVTPTTGASS